MLKPQDIVILLKMISSLSEDDLKSSLSQNELAVLLCMSVSEVNAGIKRLASSGLLVPAFQKGSKSRAVYVINEQACEEYLISGVKYSFPAKLGEYTRGIAAAYAAPILSEHIVLGDDPIPVWPYGEGSERGLTLAPLYSSVPKSVAQHPDPLFYDLLVLVDTIRIGRARERSIAVKILKEIINDKTRRKGNIKSGHARDGGKKTRQA